MKKFLYLLIVFCFLIFAGIADAYTGDEVTNYGAPEFEAYSNDFDILVMDFVIPDNHGLPDVLNAITVQNVGTTGIDDIGGVYLWTDDGDNIFQGMGVDHNLGKMNYTDLINGWYITNLNQPIPAGGLHVFLTVETVDSISSSGFLQFRIVEVLDYNGDGAFNGIDTGIYVESTNDGPTKGVILNPKTQTVNDDSGDDIGPKINFTSFKDGDIIDSLNDFKIEGLARDRMGTTIDFIEILITKADQTIVGWQGVTHTIGNEIYDFEYVFKNIEAGEYTIKMKARDASGNTTETDPYSLTFRASAEEAIPPSYSPVFSPENSTFTINRDLASVVQGFDVDLRADAVVKDQMNEPMKQKQVTIKYIKDTGTSGENTMTTDSFGRMIWGIQGTSPGIATFTLLVDNMEHVNHPTVKFIDTSLKGRLIKTEESTAVYLVQGAKRYVFPTQAVYKSYLNDFSTVDIVESAELAQYPLGGNITFRPGSLIKVPSVPKVYRVNESGVINWIETEVKATSMYGEDWPTMVHDVSEAFFMDYTEGTSLN